MQSTVKPSNLDRSAMLDLLTLYTEKEKRVKQRMRANLRAVKNSGIVTPESVAQFAYLHFTDERNLPIVPAVHHWLWLTLLCDRSIKRLLIVAPPESAKTTWLMAYAATQIAVQPQLPRIITSASGATAVTRSEALRTLLQSESFHETFPEVLPVAGMSYRAESWGVADHGIPRKGRIHPTMRAAGQTGPIIGGRAFEIYGDDILDEENTLTAKKREKVYTWLFRTLLSRLSARVGRIILIGTPWHHDDAYSRIRASNSWVVCHTPLLSEHDEVFATITYPPNWQGQVLGRPLLERVYL